MPEAMRRAFLPLVFCLFLACALAECGKTEPPVSSPANQYDYFYDGNYAVNFESQGALMAAAEIAVVNDAVSGAVTNTGNQKFEIRGLITAGGELRLGDVANTAGVSVRGLGTFNPDGTVEGSYAVGERKGRFRGFRFGPPDGASGEFDGRYKIAFRSNEKKIVSAVLEVSGSNFESQVEMPGTEAFSLRGKVLRNGTLVVPTSIGSRESGLAVTLSIDENRQVSGAYFTSNGDKGTVKGAIGR